MWLSFYNAVGVGDTLLLTKGTEDRYQVAVETKGNVTQIKSQKTGQVIGYNLAQASTILSLDQNGQVLLTSDQEALVKQAITSAGFDVANEDFKTQASLLVGYVETCVPHPDSDHLSITQTRVGEDKVLQIVCGAPNVKAGQKVVAATPGTFMPNGAIIWEGELRGVKSQGMLCSARELGMADTGKKGILVLDDSAVVGQAFQVN